MAQRSALPSTDLVYSEADVAEFRSQWERSEKERRVEGQLATLVTAFEAFPARMEEIARRVVLQVLMEQHRDNQIEMDRRIGLVGSFSTAVQALTAVAVLYLALHGAHLL